MKLAAKLILISVIAVIAVMAASNFYAAHFALARFKRNHQRYADKMAVEMEKPIIDAWKNGGLEALEEQLAPQYGQPIARWVWFEETVTEKTKPYAEADFSEVVTQRRTVSFISTMGDGSRKLFTYYPVDLGESRAGGLEFTKTLEEHERETMEDLVEFLIAISSMTVVSILVVWLAGVRMIGRPLEELTAATKRIGDGDFAVRVKLPGKNELTQLADSINHMSQRLEDQQRSIADETANKLNALKQLRHVDRLKTVGRMAAGIGHQLGTPLSVISGRAALIAEGELTDEAVKTNAMTIKNETEQISATIRQVLDFARQAPTPKSSFDLNQILIHTTELLKPLTEKKKTEVKVSLATEPAMSIVDPELIRQVLTNIIVNAIQSMPDGGLLELGISRHRTAFESSTATDYWVISIKDQGSGISDDNLENIFEPFYTTKDIGEGTGLGLSIAHSIVQEHKGWIDVESKPSEGTQFQIHLPVFED